MGLCLSKHIFFAQYPQKLHSDLSLVYQPLLYTLIYAQSTTKAEIKGCLDSLLSQKMRGFLRYRTRPLLIQFISFEITQ